MSSAAKSCLKIICLIAVIIFVSQAVNGQNSISGAIITANDQPIQFINVYVKSIGRGSVTDAKGQFTIENLAAGKYEITTSGVGYATKIIQVSVPGPQVKIQLQEAGHQLEEVIVEGKSETRLAMEQPIKSTVINTKAFSRQPSTMIELMNRSAGVRIRQTGGLGSEASISVNGFRDKAIKFFKDGIPMDYLGAGYNFSLVPANMLDRLEIYKGVLPVGLGADALGGALNMVTKKSSADYAEASYEIASFNTHRVSINALHQDSTRKYFVGGEAFFNYSDNDYKVTAPVQNPETSNIENKEVRLFHAAFKQYYGEIYGGLINTKLADEFRIGLTGFWIDRENQYGTRMLQVFGGSTSTQYSIIPTLRYKKNIFNDKFTIDQFLVVNTLHVEQVDTAGGTYNWEGAFIPKQEGDPNRGEGTRGALSDIAYSIVTSRSNLGYYLTANHKLELNAVFTNLKRLGSDPLGIRFKGSDIDVLSIAAYYNKSVTSLGLESNFFRDKIINNLIVKYYRYQTDALDAEWDGTRVDQSNSNTRWGIADALKITLTDRSFVRVSAEAATRLPEQEEIFGNGNMHLANFALKPERSTNANIGFRTAKGDKFSFEVNTFYRITHDLILKVPYNLIFSQNQNVQNVKGMGFDVDGAVTLLSWLKANGNFTYQDFRLFDTGVKTREGARLRNTPFFFANLGLNASSKRLFRDHDRFQAYWYYTFVREYYLDYLPKDREPEGLLGLWGDAGIDAKNRIPDQNLHTIGITYFPFDEKISFGMQCKNIFDAGIYDNFKIQNAGRSFHFKVTYTLN